MIDAPVIEDAPVSRRFLESRRSLTAAGKCASNSKTLPPSCTSLGGQSCAKAPTTFVRKSPSARCNNPSRLTQIGLIDAVVPGAVVSGNVKGSPVTAGTWFLGFEHPLSDCRVRADRASCWLSARTSAASRPERDLFVRDRRGPCRAVAPRLPELRGTRTRSSLSNVSALQLLVRPGILRPLQRAGRGRCGSEFRRGTDEEARRQARQLSLRRWLGRSHDSLEIQSRFSRRPDESRANRGQLRRRARHLAFSLGRLRQAESSSVLLPRARRDSKPTKADSRSPGRSTIATSAIPASR